MEIFTLVPHVSKNLSSYVMEYFYFRNKNTCTYTHKFGTHAQRHKFVEELLIRDKNVLFFL